jgi:hypothetical protein
LRELAVQLCARFLNGVELSKTSHFVVVEVVSSAYLVYEFSTSRKAKPSDQDAIT